MDHESPEDAKLSPWWRHAVILVMAFGFTLLTIVTVKTYQGAPPIPARVVDASGRLLFTADDMNKGQEVRRHSHGRCSCSSSGKERRGYRWKNNHDGSCPSHRKG
jgi:nitric oxide reductase large subunit